MDRLWLQIILLLGAACILTETQFVCAGTQTFTGDYQLTESFDHTVPQEIPFTVAQDSVVYLSFSSECLTEDSFGIRFETSWNAMLTEHDYWYALKYYKKVSGIVQPYGPFPLKAGDYQVTLTCGGDSFSEGTAVGYSLTVSTTPANAMYAFDPEPDWTENDAIDLHATQSFEGALGYGGHVGIPGHGGDSHDYYYFNLQEGTKYQVKIEYDDTFTGSWNDKDLRLLVDNNGVFTAHLPTGSGYITPEYTVGPGWGCPGTWSCPLRIWVSTGVYSTPSSFPAKGYGGYKVTMIIREEPEPNFELTYPAGKSPKVFTKGWVFGAIVTYQDENGHTVDISGQVRWQGTGTFSPATGSRSYPAFTSEGQNTITLSVVIDGKTFSKEYQVEAVSSLNYARIGDQARAPADAHGCRACPHSVTGPILSGSSNVSVQGLPAARVGDVGVHAACCGPNTFTIHTGDENILIDGRPAARLGDITAHCGATGRIISGSDSLKKNASTALKNCSIIQKALTKEAGGTVSGKITDSNMNGIHGVGVNAYGETILDVWGTITNEHGEYSITGLPDDNFRIHFWGGNLSFNDGYISSWYNEKTGMDSADSITISGSNTISDINTTLSVGGGISGTVTDEHGNGIKQITIGAYGESGDNAWGFTDENGEYSIGGLKNDTYKVQCLAENMGYISEWYNNATSQNTATPVVITTTTQLAGIDCALATAGKITGTVTDGARENLAGVYVKAFGQSTGKTGVGTTDQNGMFEILGIPSDSYRVQFDGESSGYNIIWYETQTGWDGANLVPVTMSQSTDKIDAQLKKLGFSWPIFLPAFTRPKQE